MLYCKSNRFNAELVDKKINQMKDDVESGITWGLDKYSRIYMTQAIELADLIFENNLDKMYFLRQYIKDGNVSSKPLVKSVEFTRRKCK